MPEYDTLYFSPPAPVASVSWLHPATGRAVHDVPMLIDTGADVTLVPIEPLKIIEVEMLPQRYALPRFDGTSVMADAVHLNLQFLGKVFRGQFLMLDQPWGVLGRNVLNRLRLLLDGPNLLRQEFIRRSV